MMEFPFDINVLLGDEITVLDRTIKPFISNPANASQRRAELCKVIDEMGRASARAQGLLSPITSANRLTESKHQLYIIKEEHGISGNGAVVGLLKIGHKKLFIYDRQGTQHELEPLCVLDFYVHESCQRRGYGRKMFEEMLRRERIDVRQIAIDRPSPKFLSFLQKHYNLKATIPQVNNYVVFEGFFSDRNVNRNGTDRRSDAGRQAWGMQEPSFEMSGVQATGNLQRNRPLQQDISYGARSQPCSRPSSGKFNYGMSAQQAMYSRHQATPSPIDLSCVASGGDNLSPVTSSPPVIRRDGPSRDYLKLLNENSNNSYMSRRGGHLLTNATTSTNSQPFSQSNRQTFLSPGVGSQQPAGNRQNLDSTWNVFGVPPRSWHSSVPAGTASNIAANQKYRRTNLW